MMKWIQHTANVITLVKFTLGFSGFSTILGLLVSFIDLGQNSLQLILIILMVLSNIIVFVLLWKQRSLLKKPLIILSAKWDAEGLEPIDCTRKVRSLVTAEGTLKIPAKRYNQLCGDPASGVEEKKFYAAYLHIGEVKTDENFSIQILKAEESMKIVSSKSYDFEGKEGYDLASKILFGLIMCLSLVSFLSTMCYRKRLSINDPKKSLRGPSALTAFGKVLVFISFLVFVFVMFIDFVEIRECRFAVFV